MEQYVFAVTDAGTLALYDLYRTSGRITGERTLYAKRVDLQSWSNEEIQDVFSQVEIAEEHNEEAFLEKLEVLGAST